MRNRPALCAWMFFAGVLVATIVALRWELRWSETKKLHVHVAAGLLIASGVVHAGMLKLAEPSLRRTIEIPLVLIALLTLCASWAAFWIADLHAARFQLVLLVVPAFAALFAIVHPLEVRGAPLVWLVLGGFAIVVIADLSSLGPNESPARAMALTLAAASMLSVLARPLPRAWLGAMPQRAPFLPAISAGLVLGTAPLWALLLARQREVCGCSCSGTSGALDTTLVVTTLAVFGAGPVAIASLLEPEP